MPFQGQPRAASVTPGHPCPLGGGWPGAETGLSLRDKGTRPGAFMTSLAVHARPRVVHDRPCRPSTPRGHSRQALLSVRDRKAFMTSPAFFGTTGHAVRAHRVLLQFRDAEGVTQSQPRATCCLKGSGAPGIGTPLALPQRGIPISLTGTGTTSPHGCCPHHLPNTVSAPCPSGVRRLHTMPWHLIRRLGVFPILGIPADSAYNSHPTRPYPTITLSVLERIAACLRFLTLTGRWNCCNCARG